MLKKYLTLSIIALLTASCSQAIDRRDAYIRPYHAGQFEEANRRVTNLIDNPANSQDAVWLLLDRATINFTSGNSDQALSDYQLAIEAIDFYSQNCTAENLEKVILQEGIGAYAGEDFEQILARIYFALALHYCGDDGNAMALLRQAENIQQKKREIYRKCKLTQEYSLIDNAFGKYLLAAMSEKKGDLSNARILYNQFGQLTGCQAAPSDPSLATVLLICHNGNAPFKIPIRLPPSVASTAALNALAIGNPKPRLSSLSGISTPALSYWIQNSHQQALVYFEGRTTPLLPCFDIGKTARKQLKAQIPNIVARGLARQMIRFATVEAAARLDPLAGCIADIALLAANCQTKADVRSWTTLPRTLDLARIDTEPGRQELTILIGSQSYPLTLDLKPRDLCLIHIFNIHPGITTLLVPDRFLKGDKI